MANYHTPDLTGSDPSYYDNNLLRRIIKPGQVILLDSPVFDNDHLEIFRIGVNLIPLSRDVDYKIDPNTDIDYDMMSRMRTVDSTFESILIKSITMMSGYSEDYTILIKSNRLFPDVITYASIVEGPEVEVTPALIASMIDNINFLRNVIIRDVSNFTPESIENNILSEDPLGTNIENNIIGESHSINTLSGTKLVKPIYGDFFKDSMVVTNVSTGVAFVRDVDYKCVNLNIIKTKASSNVSGVYKYIEFIVGCVCDVRLDYHAYGGEVTEASIRSIDQQLKLVYSFLNNVEMLTPNSMQTHPELIRINNKINEMEASMRMLLSNGIPSYGDVTHGITMKKMLTSLDNALHWWSIATLFKVSGSEDIVLADTLAFKFQSVNTDLQFECKVSYNANNIDNPLSVYIVSSNIHFNTFYNVTPSIRVIYRKEGEVYSGVTLQIGMKLKNILNETIAIEDISGKESCWKLITPSNVAVNPEDSSVVLPNGSTYIEGSVTSFSIETILPMEYNIYSNSPVSINAGINTVVIDSEFVNSNLPKISKVTLVLYQTSTPGVLYRITIPVTQSSKLIGSANCYIGLTALNFSIDHNIGDTVKITMTKINSADPAVALTLSQYLVG